MYWVFAREANPDSPALARNIVPNLVCAAGGHEVRTVRLAGRMLAQECYPYIRVSGQDKVVQRFRHSGKLVQHLLIDSDQRYVQILRECYKLTVIAEQLLRATSSNTRCDATLYSRPNIRLVASSIICCAVSKERSFRRR